MRINSRNARPVGNTLAVQTVWRHPDKNMKDASEYWLQDGPQRLDGVNAVEGPVRLVDGRVPAQLFCTTTAQFGPGNQMVEIRHMTPRDRGVLKAMSRCDHAQARRDSALEECKRDAAYTQRQREHGDDEATVTAGSGLGHAIARLLKASYGASCFKGSRETRGTLGGVSNKARKMDLFPALEDD